MAAHGETTRSSIRRFRNSIDIEGSLRIGGLNDEDLAALRRRLLISS